MLFGNKFEWCVIQRSVNSNPLGRTVNSNPLNFHPQTLFLTEPGVYQLIFRSHLLSTEAFQDWVFSEVLPSIRKTGSYSMNNLCNALGGMTLKRSFEWRQEPANGIQNYPHNTREHVKRSCQGGNGKAWWIKVPGK